MKTALCCWVSVTFATNWWYLVFEKIANVFCNVKQSGGKKSVASWFEIRSASVSKSAIPSICVLLCEISCCYAEKQTDKRNENISELWPHQYYDELPASQTGQIQKCEREKQNQDFVQATIAFQNKGRGAGSVKVTGCLRFCWHADGLHGESKCFRMTYVQIRCEMFKFQRLTLFVSVN